MSEKEVVFFREHLKSPDGVEVFIKHLMQKGQQNVHTPFSLCREIIEKLKEYTDISEKKIAVLFNTEFLHVLINDFGVNPKNIVMFADDIVEYEFCKLQYKLEPQNLFQIDIEHTVSEKTLHTTNGECNMKFDVIVGNPPYQSDSKGSGAGHTLWDKFVSLSLDSLTENEGYICLVHPSNWRGTGKLSELGWKMRAKQIEYLEIHDVSDGLKVFGAATRYDWYVIKNTPSKHNTIVKGQNGIIEKLDLNNFLFIPNGKLQEISKLIAKNETDRVNYLYDRTVYGSDKSHMSSEKSITNPYPCVMHVNVANTISCVWYSNTKDRGHFDIPKVIAGRMASGVFVDRKGEYGLSDAAFAIVDKPENLDNIAKAMLNERFIELSKMMSFGLKDRYDRNAIRYLRKDFWKEFI